MSGSRERYSISNIKRMTPAAHKLARKNLHYSSLSTFSIRKIILIILLLSLPPGTQAISPAILALIPLAIGFGTAVVTQMGKPIASAGAAAIGSKVFKDLLKNTNVKILIGIMAALSLVYFYEKINRAKTNQLKIRANLKKAEFNFRNRREERRARTIANTRNREERTRMFSTMFQIQNQLTTSLIAGAQQTRIVQQQLILGNDPIIPIPAITVDANVVESRLRNAVPMLLNTTPFVLEPIPRTGIRKRAVTQHNTT